HGYTNVIGAADGFGEESIGCVWAIDVDVVSACVVDRRDDLRCFLRAEQAAITCMRIESGNADFRMRDAELVAGGVCEVDHFADAVALDSVTRLPQRYVR